MTAVRDLSFDTLRLEQKLPLPRLPMRVMEFVWPLPQ